MLAECITNAILSTKLRLPVLPYLYACTFIADSASFLLPVSNPINIIVSSRFPLDLLTFLRLLFLPSLVVIGTNIGIFFLLYRNQLKGAFVVRAIEDTGLSTKFGNWLIHLSGGTSLGAVMVGTAGAALGTNLINNVPMAVVMISGLAGIQNASPAVQHGFIAATIFGCSAAGTCPGAGPISYCAVKPAESVGAAWHRLRQRPRNFSGRFGFRVVFAGQRHGTA